ncbi:MAG: type II secretion system F family protein [Candidatus Eisenbacteria bacterium]
MRAYLYEAMVADGHLVRGESAAENLPALHAVLERRGLTLVRAKERRARRIEIGRGRSSQEELIEFTRSMASLMGAGIPLMQALEDLGEQAEKKSWREMLADMRNKIEDGSTVSEALATRPKVFDDLYINLIRAGEEGGKLKHSFEKLAEHLERARIMRQELRHTLSYPLMILGALACFAGILTFFVFPRLSVLFESLDVDLPFTTRVVLALGRFGRSGWPFVLGSAAAGTIVLRELWAHPKTRFGIDALILRIPLIGRLIRMSAYARFSEMIATLLVSGVPLDRALGLAQNGVGNRVIGRAVAYSRDAIQGGESFSGALSGTGQFPQLVIRMVKVGETSGDVPGMLSNLVQHYEREMPYLFRKAMSALGPATIVVLVVMVGFAALAVFQPLLQIASALR